MYKQFLIVLFALAVVPVAAVRADDKPKKADEKPKKAADNPKADEPKDAAAGDIDWKNLTPEEVAELKERAAAQAKRKRAKDRAKGVDLVGPSTVHHSMRATATPAPATVPKPDKVEPKTTEAKETPKPAPQKWQIVSPEEEAEADKLIKTILAKWSQTKKFSAKYRKDRATGQLKGDLDGTNWEYVTLTETQGTYDLKKDKGKVLVRMEIQVGDAYERIDDSKPRKFHVTNWFDGDYLYSLRKWEDQYAAEKREQTQGGLMIMGGEDFFKELKRNYKLRVREPRKLGDRDVVILEGVTKLGEEKAGLALHWFDKESGILLKLATYEFRRRPKWSITLEELNLNPVFPANHFKFAAPQGVHLRDLTKNFSSPTDE